MYFYKVVILRLFKLTFLKDKTCRVPCNSNVLILGNVQFLVPDFLNSQVLGKKHEDLNFQISGFENSGFLCKSCLE